MATQASKSARPHEFQRLAELIGDIRVAMLVTFPHSDDTSGGIEPHCRPMYTQTVEADEFDGTLWFMTNAASDNVKEIAENDEVLITYAAPDKNRFVAVRGRAQTERNPEKARELWNVHAKGWFPDGPTDASLLLIQVRVSSAEYWDGPSSASYFMSLFKAVATGQKPKVNLEHGKI